MNDVTVDVERRSVRVGAGALWIDVVEPVAAAGFAVLHGSSPDVGVAGYSLGGGMGWFARKYGLQTNQLTAVELVTADGALIRADREHHAELFWALRGGGGNFGVVTAMEFPILPIESAYAGWLVWDWHRAAEVLPAWLAWTRDCPDEVMTSLRILQLPPIEAVPEPLRGKQIVAIDGAVLGTDDEAIEVLAPLRALAPEMDTFARMPAPALVRLHGDPEGPTPGISATGNLGPAAIEDAAAFTEAFVGAAGPDSGSPLLLAELRQLGGALGRPDPDGGAVPMLDGSFVLFGLGMPMAPGDAEAIHAHAHRLVAACRPWSNGRSYLNFAEEAVDVASAYAPETLARLAAVRDEYDPHGVFVANHPVG